MPTNHGKRNPAETPVMQGEMVPFAFDAHAVRVLDIEAMPWFVASDIAAVLEYTAAPQMTRILDEDEKGVQIVHTLGGDQRLQVINESGLFSAILRSRKPEARRFRRWVTAEVLPALRRSGRYAMPAQRDWVADREQLLAQVAAIRAEPSGEVRAALHHQLADFCTGFGVPVPALDAILCASGAGGRTADPALVRDFRDALEQCELRCMHGLNHARDLGLRAYNLNQVQAVADAHGIEMPRGSMLRAALHADPHFVAVRAVNSALLNRTVKCLVFRPWRDAAPTPTTHEA